MIHEKFPHVPEGSKAARNWRRLRERGDLAGLRALEDTLEGLSTPAEVRALPFCRCGCGRLSLSMHLDDLGEVLVTNDPHADP